MMDAEATTVEQPKYPVHALTTYELCDYRGQLERALTELPEHAEIRMLVQQRLNAVLKEQDERARHSSSSRGVR
jgi:hypothetical protein